MEFVALLISAGVVVICVIILSRRERKHTVQINEILKNTESQIQIAFQKGKEESNNQIIDLYNQNIYLQEIYQGELKVNNDLKFEKEQFVNALPELIETERKKAIESSRVVLTGKISEHVAPFMPDFKYKSSDLRFLGSPVDFLCLDGMSDGVIKQVVLIDVKTGNAQLTERQKQIRAALEKCQVQFEVFRIESK